MVEVKGDQTILHYAPQQLTTTPVMVAKGTITSGSLSSSSTSQYPTTSPQPQQQQNSTLRPPKVSCPFFHYDFKISKIDSIYKKTLQQNISSFLSLFHYSITI